MHFFSYLRTCTIAVALLLLMLLGIAGGCRKRKTPAPEVTEEQSPLYRKYANYFPLKKGNYWVYIRFQIDQQGTYTPGGLDSSYVKGDTIIRGKTFFKLVPTHHYPNSFWIITDSLHYVIDQTGTIVLSTENFQTNLKSGFEAVSTDTMYKYNVKMTDRDSIFTLPAGTFKTINAQGTYTIFPSWHSPGTRNPKHADSRYARDVGLVYELSEYISVDVYVGKKLFRYHVN